MTFSKNIRINLLRMSLILLVSFFYGFNFTFAASVDVGDDVNLEVPVSEDLQLSVTTSGFDLCDMVDYMWEDTSETLFIEMPYEKDMATIYSSDLNDNPGTYTIKLTATCNGGDPDEGGFIEEDSFILTIDGGSSNESPTDIELSRTDIDENVSTGSIVGDLSTTDSDSTSFIYNLIDTVSYPDNDKFKIDGEQLTVDFSPDYETKNSYSIKIQTDDQEGGIYEKVFTITINDIDETVASVDAGEEQNVIIGDTVNLNGILNGFPENGCNFVYNWYDDTGQVNIEKSGTLDQARFDTSSFTGTTRLKIGFEVKVSSTQMTHDSCGKTGIYNDDVYVNINEDTSSGSGETTTTHHHSSYSSRMRAEANNIFKNPKKIKLNLYEDNPKNDYFYMLKWNYIGGDGQINYELEYSNTKDFKKYKKITTKSRFYNFLKSELEESEIYFFRVKAIYKNKESSYSNILSIVNKDNPLKDFKIKCINCRNKINYGDVFETTDLLIEKYLNISCKGCVQKKLKYLFSDIFIYNKKFELKIDKNKYCRDKINFDDVFNYEKGLGFKVECSGKNKINYDNLLK